MANVIGELLVDGPNAKPVQSVEEMAGRFHAELLHLIPAWKDKFKANPQTLPALEREVHQAFAKGADFVVTGLLAHHDCP